MFPSHLPTPRRPAAQAFHPALGHYRSWLDRRALCALIENLQPAAGGGGGFPQPGEGRPGGRGMGDPQAYGQVEEMLARPDIDAVYIATPHNHHFPDGMQALKAGKHVLIEKPFALNLGEGRELQAEAARQEAGAGGNVVRLRAEI